MHQRTNELLQGIISQILKIKIQNVMTGGRLNWRKKHKKHKIFGKINNFQMNKNLNWNWGIGALVHPSTWTLAH